jgi:hypothetical protein
MIRIRLQRSVYVTWRITPSHVPSRFDTLLAVILAIVDPFDREWIVQRPSALQEGHTVVAPVFRGLFRIPLKRVVAHQVRNSGTGSSVQFAQRNVAELQKAGVSAIYGPGTNIPGAAAEILSLIRKHRVGA